jgi:hypothetical protein
MTLNNYKIYSVLMEMLDQTKILSPQVIGLTASLGVGDNGWDMESCRKHMLKLCSNLKANSISTVRHQLDNLRDHVVPLVDDVQRVKRPINNRFIEEIDRVMLSIEQGIQPELKKLIENGYLTNKVTFSDY